MISNILINVGESVKRRLKNIWSKNFQSFTLKQPIKSKIRKLRIFETVPLETPERTHFLGFRNISKNCFQNTSVASLLNSVSLRSYKLSMNNSTWRACFPKILPTTGKQYFCILSEMFGEFYILLLCFTNFSLFYSSFIYM